MFEIIIDHNILLRLSGYGGQARRYCQKIYEKDISVQLLTFS